MTTAAEQATEAALAREATRVHLRYQIEIVEACGLCPWAEKSRLDGHVRVFVLFETDPSCVDPSVEAMASLSAAEDVEVAFLIYPLLELTRLEFEAFASRVRATDATKHEVGRIPFVSAAFHPEAAADVTQAERLIPFLRRSPDPTIQLIRGAMLEKVRGPAPQGTQFIDLDSHDIFASAAAAPTTASLRERIAKTNLATTIRMGVPEMSRRMDDIRRDRNEAYGRVQGASTGRDPR